MKRVLVCTVVVILSVTSLCGGNATDSSCGGCRILTPYIEKDNASVARNLSTVDPNKFLGVKSHSGFITVNGVFNSNLFFWFFPAKSDLKDTPWIIWLQGGPGITSMIGLFDLIGPLQIVDGKVQLRNVTWASNYSILFVDNPVGAGFSFTENEYGYPDNENDVGLQLMEFLRQFLEMFPELRSAPLFVAGESYAGKYVPALSIQIHRHRVYNSINLRGLIIGNGLIDPYTLMHYSELLSGLGLLEEYEINAVKRFERDVIHLIDEGKMVNASNKYNETIEYIKKRTGVSIYNYNADPEVINKAPEFEEFLNWSDIREVLGTGNVTFDTDNQYVYNKMLPDIMNSTKPWIEELLQYYGVICYHGQLDIFIAYSLAMHTYRSLKWPRRIEYADATRLRIRDPITNRIVAYKKGGGNFNEVLIRGAGHKAPADQPKVCKSIVDTFIQTYK